MVEWHENWDSRFATSASAVARDASVLESPELEFLPDPIDIKDSMETCFQEMNARIQANEYILIDLLINISKVLQILR